jgi:superoxide reductase
VKTKKLKPGKTEKYKIERILEELIMNQTPKFYFCEACGNIVEMIEDSGIELVCCGDYMQELVPNTTDAANEKHVPVIEVNGNTVKVTVGSTIHPMGDDHHIAWIVLYTEKGCQRKYLDHNGEPVATFELADGDKAVSAYEYCNIHGLWKADV